MRSDYNDGTLTVFLEGRVDSNNAQDVEKEIQNILDERAAESLIINAKDLEYISSAGLRVFLHFRKWQIAVFISQNVINFVTT